MSEFKVGDRVKHSKFDLERGYGAPEDEGTVVEVATRYPDDLYPFSVLWDHDPDFAYHYLAKELEVI